MANPEHLSILKQDVWTWNEWREKNPETRPDLNQADLHGANLFRVDFRKVDLRDTNLKGVNFSYEEPVFLGFMRENLLVANLVADLSDANISGANLARANLYGVSLREANLTHTQFEGADLSKAILIKANLSNASLVRANLTSAFLREANLSNAMLNWAELQGADLTGADLNGALLFLTSFGNVDLSMVKGIEGVEHGGPSIIGIDTIFRSQGKIPEVFLRGAGVPDIFIEYARSLVAKPIQFFSCFISHSSHDKRFCDRLYADLQANHVRVWYFPEDAKWGEPVWGEIDRSIKIYDKLIVVCSQNSLTSGPVLREIERALRREDEEQKNILFPITIDDYIFHDWQHPRQADVMSKVVGDFRGATRRGAKYDAAFKKLVKALKA